MRYKIPVDPTTTPTTPSTTTDRPITPTPTGAGTVTNDTTTVTPTTEPESSTQAQFSSCQGYRTGNPANRDRTHCIDGALLNGVSHEQAFGFSGNISDWKTCDLPRLPEEK